MSKTESTATTSCDGTASVESDDASPTPSQRSFLSHLLERMNPTVCLGIYHHDDDFDAMIQAILNDLKDPATSTAALKRLFCQTDLAHQQNRVPMVCTSEYDVVASLTTCLTRDEDRRYACLTLNNLSIPFEAKSVMVFGPSSESLLNTILQEIQQGCAEVYLLCILLFNLSFLEDAKLKLLEYNGGLDNPKSLIRTMQLLLKIYSQFLKKPVLSVEGEAVRWTTGLMRNLTSTETGACMLAKTKIPSYILSFVRDSTRPLHQWTQDSLEDFALQTLCNLATYDESVVCLKELGAQHAFDDIVGKGGIHDVRASFLQVHLQ